MTSALPVLLALFALFAMFLLLAIALHHIRRKELSQELADARWQIRYHQQETEIALSVSQSISNTIAARLATVYGSDYADYLIARQMNLPEQQTEPREPLRVIYSDNRGYNISDGSAWDREMRRQQRADEARQRPACWRKPPRYATEPRYTPPQHWQPQPQAPCFRQPENLPYWDDDDVLDVTPVISPPVYPPALQPPPVRKPANGGRQRKYASNAERQAAYRERKKARNGR